MNLYIAGKVSKDSGFGTHYWRDDFCKKLSEISKMNLTHLDPLSVVLDFENPDSIFASDVQLINQSECVVVYLSDDISVGGSQEIIIAKYLKKPVIGFAPYGGKFNGSSREMNGKIIKNFKDPFVFATCDIVCGTIEEVAQTLTRIDKIEVKTLSIIDKALDR